MILEAKSQQASLGKLMVDFNEVYPTLFLRFYKSSNFEINNRYTHSTKLKDHAALPLKIEINPDDKVSEVISKLGKALNMKYIEVCYYTKDTTGGATRLMGDALNKKIKDIQSQSSSEGWLTQKELKKYNAV
jgi:hypothetical protein